MPTKIQEFFERYRNAFKALDGEVAARLYAYAQGKFEPESFFPQGEQFAIADLR